MGKKQRNPMPGPPVLRIMLPKMVSTRNLSGMPEVQKLRKLTQSLATLDAILQRDWEGRYYAFNSKWKADEQMASMRNGEGDEWFCLFTPAGAFLKGLDHESEMARAWPGLLDKVPEAFQSALTEPAFSIQYTSFCIWRTYEDDRWHTGSISYPAGDDPDGSGWMLSVLDCNPNTYRTWAQDYYKRSIDLAVVKRVYAYEPLTEGLVRSLNPSLNLSDLSDDLQEIAYPLSTN